MWFPELYSYDLHGLGRVSPGGIDMTRFLRTCFPRGVCMMAALAQQFILAMWDLDDLQMI